jgi:hypothetical protein
MSTLFSRTDSFASESPLEHSNAKRDRAPSAHSSRHSSRRDRESDNRYPPSSSRSGATHTTQTPMSSVSSRRSSGYKAPAAASTYSGTASMASRSTMRPPARGVAEVGVYDSVSQVGNGPAERLNGIRPERVLPHQARAAGDFTDLLRSHTRLPGSTAPPLPRSSRPEGMPGISNAASTSRQSHGRQSSRAPSTRSRSSSVSRSSEKPPGPSSQSLTESLAALRVRSDATSNTPSKIGANASVVTTSTVRPGSAVLDEGIWTGVRVEVVPRTHNVIVLPQGASAEVIDTSGNSIRPVPYRSRSERVALGMPSEFPHEYVDKKRRGKSTTNGSSGADARSLALAVNSEGRSAITGRASTSSHHGLGESIHWALDRALGSKGGG